MVPKKQEKPCSVEIQENSNMDCAFYVLNIVSNHVWEGRYETRLDRVSEYNCEKLDTETGM